MLPILRRNTRSAWESPLDLLDREFNRAVGRAFEGNGDWAVGYPVDITEDDNNILVEAEMPGFKRDEISVTLESGILSITGERKAQDRKGQEHLTERRYLKVARSFTLPTSIDESKIDAKLEEGVLKLRLPKTEAVKPHRIAVK